VGITGSNEISEITRREIFDSFMIGNIPWAGRLAEDEFLSRIFDLTSLPSHDPRFHNAAGDIFQHCVRNQDWSPEWVFYDSRFGLLYGRDDVFLKFLCETIHPVVRPEVGQSDILVNSFNDMLSHDGWEIFEVKKISGKSVYGARKTGDRVLVFEEPTGWQKVDRQLQEVRLRLNEAQNEEQFQAVGLLCREVLISVAQEVYDRNKHFPSDGVAPSATDAKRMLGGIFDCEFVGNANENARKHARAAVDLALALQHKRTADFRTAALCAEASCSVVNMLAVIAGRRGRPI